MKEVRPAGWTARMPAGGSGRDMPDSGRAPEVDYLSCARETPVWITSLARRRLRLTACHRVRRRASWIPPTCATPRDELAITPVLADACG